MSDSKKTTVEQIRAQAQASRLQLADAIGQFADEMKPKNIAQKAAEDAKTFVSAEVRSAMSHVKNEDGWRVDRIVAISGAVLGVVTLWATVRAIVSRAR